MENKMIYFKQYGEMRTGTNYLKRLVELNFDSVKVFGSILGWKHGMYDLNNSPDTTNSHEEWVTGKTEQGVVYSVDGHRLPHTPSELITIIPKLKYLISIKNPYAFVVSYKKFRFPNKKLHNTVILNLCERYNSKYSRWLKFTENNQDNCMFIPYETMLMNYTHVLFNIEQKYKLSRVRDKYTDELSPVNASTDHGLLIDKKKNFNKEYYLDRLYLNELTDEHLAIIDDNIDSTLVDDIYKMGL